MASMSEELQVLINAPPPGQGLLQPIKWHFAAKLLVGMGTGVLMEGLVYLYSLLCLLQRCAEVFKPASPQMSAQQHSAVRFLPVNVPFPSVVAHGFLWNFSTLIF